MAIKNYKPTSPARRFYSGSDFKELTKGKKPERALLEHQTAHRWSQHARPHHQPLPWRRPQAALPHHRLAPRQDRRSGRGRFDRVRSEPHRAHRAPQLRRRREALHPRARRHEGRRHGRREPQRGHQARQLDAAPPHPARHDDPQPRDAQGQGRPARSLGRRRARSSWRRTATTRRSACPRAKSA